jgi:hypothetical protein
VLLAAAACGPGGPSSKDLDAEPAFTTTMPGAADFQRGGQNASTGIEGSTFSYAWRIQLSQDVEAAVLAWHQDTFEVDGWMPVNYPYITMQDGHFPANAWRRGDLVLGLGFPDRHWLNREYPAGTLYEVTITYQPAATPT